MRTFFMLLGEFAEALYKHFERDAEFRAVVLDLVDQVLTAFGAPDVVPGEPGVIGDEGVTPVTPSSEPPNPRVFDWSAR